MKKFYLWRRVWPGFQPSFPFESVETLEGNLLLDGLDRLASKWSAEHPGAVDQQRAAEHRSYVLQQQGTASCSFDPNAPPLEPLRLTNESPPGFLEVAHLAGWIGNGSFFVRDTGPLGMYTPETLLYYYTTHEAVLAKGITEVLRQRSRMRMAKPRLGIVQGILRHGFTDGQKLSQAERVLLELRIADYRAVVTRVSGAVDTLGLEAERIEQHFMQDGYGIPGDAPSEGENEAETQPCDPPEPEDERAVRVRIPEQGRADRVIEVLRLVKAMPGEFARAAEIVACGISGRTLNSAGLKWGKDDVRNRGLRELAYRRARVIKYLVTTWDPRTG